MVCLLRNGYPGWTNEKRVLGRKLIERAVTVGYLLSALTLSYYPSRKKAFPEVRKGGGGQPRLVGMALAVPALVGTPVLFAAAGDWPPGWMFVAALGVSALSVGLVGPLFTRRMPTEGREATRWASWGTSLVLALGRFVVLAVVGGWLLAEIVGLNPALASVVLVVTAGLLHLPNGRVGAQRVDLLHVFLCILAATAIAASVVGLSPRASEEAIRPGTLSSREFLLLLLASLVLSIWFWSDDTYVRQRDLGKAGDAGMPAFWAMFPQLLLLAFAAPVLLLVGRAGFGERGAAWLGDLGLGFRVGVLLFGLCGVLSGMGASLRAALLAGAGIVSGNACVEAGNHPEPLRSQLAAVALLVVMFPVVQVAAHGPATVVSLVASAMVVLIPPVAATRWAAVFAPGSVARGCGAGIVAGWIFGCGHLMARWVPGSPAFAKTPLFSDWYVFVPASLVVSVATMAGFSWAAEFVAVRGSRRGSYRGASGQESVASTERR